MTEARDSNAEQPRGRSTVERASDREMVVTRAIRGPAHLVFQAWTQAELFQRWWVPQSLGMTLLSCEMDVRVGGAYRLAFQFDPEPLVFHGRYLEVVPDARLVWTNEEVFGSGQITTVTFEEQAGETRVVVRELYPSKDALDAAIAAGSTSGDMQETFDQLEALLPALSS